MTKIAFERSGGFLGQNIELNLDLDTLPASEALNLIHLVQQAEVARRGLNCNRYHRACLRRGNQPGTQAMDFCMDLLRENERLRYEDDFDVFGYGVCDRQSVFCRQLCDACSLRIQDRAAQDEHRPDSPVDCRLKCGVYIFASENIHILNLYANSRCCELDLFSRLDVSSVRGCSENRHARELGQYVLEELEPLPL